MNLNPPVFIAILCGVIYIITAWIFMRYPPKKINDFYGYRTARSKKSQAHWDFAQKVAAKYFLQTAYYCLLSCTLFIVFDFGEHAVWIAIIPVSLLPFVALIQTEQALKKKFKD